MYKWKVNFYYDIPATCRGKIFLYLTCVFYEAYIFVINIRRGRYCE